MLSSHIVINLLECNNKPANIYNISYNNNNTTTRNKDRCNNFDTINRAARQDKTLTTHATPPISLSQTSVIKDKAISFKHSSSSDYTLDIIQLMGLEMPPVRRKGFSGNNYSVRNGPHSTTSLPNLHQAVSVRSSISSSTAPSTSQHHRGTADLLIGDDSSDSGVSSRSPTPINNFLASAGAAGDHGLTDEHFIKKTIKEVKQVNSNSTNSSGSSSSVRLSGAQHNSHYSHHLGFHQETQAKQHHSRNHNHRNSYSVNGNCNNSISNGSAENNNNKKRFHHSNRHSLPIQSPGRGRIMSGMVVHVPTLPPPVPPPMSPISSLPLHIMSHCPLSSMMYSITTPPDRFLSKCHLVQITKTPLHLTDGSHWDELSKAVWNKFLTNQQTAETYKKKLTLWKCLYLYIKTMCPRYSLYLVGSTLSGFGSNTSDVDMCLIVRRQEMDQRSEALFHLSNILFHLHHLDGIEKLELVQAKVPILKFRERDQGIDVDLNCNNAVGIRNTHLLSCYSKLDWRVRPLVLVVKLWAQWHDINDAKNMTISSYSLALMVIHFLQCGVHPPVLPCLHSLYENKFSSQRDISSIDIHEEILYRSDNHQSLGELLLQFFSYFDSFDYSLYAVSVRLAARIPIDDCRKARSLKNEPHQWKYLCIEEPFDLTNTARSVYDLEAFERIRSIIHDTYRSLNATHTLDSIFRIERSPSHKNHHNHMNNLHQQLNHHRNSASHHHITHQQYSTTASMTNAWTNHHRSHSVQSPHNSSSSLMSEQTGAQTLQSLTLSQPQIHTQSYLL